MPYGYELMGIVNLQSFAQESAQEELRHELGVEELTEAQEKRITSAVGNEFAVLENLYALPLGYCYDTYITHENWESLDPVQKQEVQLKTAYVDGLVLEGMEEYSGAIPNYILPFEVTLNSDEIAQIENGFVTTTDNVTAVLAFQGKKDSEIYIRLSGLDFEPTAAYDLYWGDESIDPLNLYNQANWGLLTGEEKASFRMEKVFWDDVVNITMTFQSAAKKRKTLTYRPADAPFSSGRQNYIINLGYSQSPVGSITITFPKRGRYTFEDLQIYCVPMGYFEEKTNIRKQYALQNIELDTDTIRGTLDVPSSRLLCVAVPYSSGWKACIDGQQSPVLMVNEHYVGLLVQEGYHCIELRYSMPYKRVGLALSLFGAVALLITIVMTEKKRGRITA